MMIRRGSRDRATPGAGEPSAIRAAGHLVRVGILEIRTMAVTRQVLAVGEDADPESPYETEFSARINMIADVCHELTAALLEEDPAIREEIASAALAYRWSVSIPEARRWITSRLAQLDGDHTRFLT
ncbi:hypothetical protein [Sphaerisporangium corydalis]|uniref:Uncharacterized protein n=1 Tax=Sphaerisporangium corydalis TaxID=1441875 RepID=A0ABV9E8G6_9ACTN|nr:hypothetical protein [Sphaerisporangium corydalis]